MDDITNRKNMDRLRKDLLPAIARKIYRENIKSVVVKNNKGEVLRYFVYDKTQTLPWWYIERGGKAEPCGNLLEMKALPIEEVKISEYFWTCECPHYFIHHMAQEKCPICKVSRIDNTNILRTTKGS